MGDSDSRKASYQRFAREIPSMFQHGSSGSRELSGKLTLKTLEQLKETIK
jgi:hypothetical protein